MDPVAQDTYREAPPKRNYGVLFMVLGGISLALFVVRLAAMEQFRLRSLLVGLMLITYGLSLRAEAAKQPAERPLWWACMALFVAILVDVAINGL